MLLLYFDNSLLCRFIAHFSKRWGRWYLSEFRVETIWLLWIKQKNRNGNKMEQKTPNKTAQSALDSSAYCPPG